MYLNLLELPDRNVKTLRIFDHIKVWISYRISQACISSKAPHHDEALRGYRQKTLDNRTMEAKINIAMYQLPNNSDGPFRHL